MRGDHRLYICVGFEPATDRLRVLIPDVIEFPVMSPWVSFIDQRHLRLSPNKHPGANQHHFRRNVSRDGAREIFITHARGLGSHFTSTRVNYRVDGPDFIVELPREEDRRPPRAWHRTVVVPPLQPKKYIEAIPDVSHTTNTLTILPSVLPDGEEVQLSGHGSVWRYNMTAEQLLGVTALINEYLHQHG